MLCFPKMLLAAVLTLPLLMSAAVQAEDWPQWRGLNRVGVCDETNLLQWFPTEGLKVRWRVPAGWGWSSPIVVQGRVYLTGSLVVKLKAEERGHKTGSHFRMSSRTIFSP